MSFPDRIEENLQLLGEAAKHGQLSVMQTKTITGAVVYILGIVDENDESLSFFPVAEMLTSCAHLKTPDGARRVVVPYHEQDDKL